MSQPAEETTRQWLRQIPHTWDVLPAKALFLERREPCCADDVHLTPSQAYGVLPQEEYMAVTGNRVVLNLAGQDNMKHVEPGDFIIHLRSFQGGLERSALQGKVSTAYTVLTPRERANGDYYRWLLKCTAYIQTLRTTTNQLRDGQSIKFGDFGKVALPAPPLEAQRSIAKFLDRETGKVDALIAEQEGLIDVLRERRSAVIERVVTRGLGSAPTVDSRVPWLGQVKEGWDVVRARYLVSIKTGYGDTVDAEPEGEYPFYVRSQTPLRSTGYDYDGPAVLTAGDGAGVAKVFHLVDGKFKAHQRVYVLNQFQRVLPAYFFYFFSTFFAKVALDGSAKSTVDSVRRWMIADMPFTVPSMEEQRLIVGHLDGETNKIDALIAEAEGIVAVAKERRSALITAAVTGQIDVRGEVA